MLPPALGPVAGTAVGAITEVASGRGVLVALAPSTAVGWGADDVAVGDVTGTDVAGADVAVADEPQATATTKRNAPSKGNRIPGVNSRCLDM